MIRRLWRATEAGPSKLRLPRGPAWIPLLVLATLSLSDAEATAANWSPSTPGRPGWLAGLTLFPPPAPTTTGIIVPSTIDATGSTDVSAALGSFIRSVPDGSTIVFKAGGTYKLGTAIRVWGRHNLVFNGNGATLRMAGCNVEDSAFLLDGPASTDISIRNFTMIGDNSGAGTTSAFVAGCESSMGVAIYGARNIDISNVTISSVHGECVYIDAGGDPRGVGPWADGINFHDSTCRLNGRMGVAIVAGSHITVARVTFERLAISVFDIEPYMANGGATYVSLTDNIIDGYGSSPTYTPWVLEGSAFGMTSTIVSDVTLARNRIIAGATRSANTGTTAGLTVKARTSRWKRFSILDNVSTVPGSGPTMWFEHIDGLTVSGNTQSVSSGSLVWFDDVTGVSIN